LRGRRKRDTGRIGTGVARAVIVALLAGTTLAGESDGDSIFGSAPIDLPPPTRPPAAFSLSSAIAPLRDLRFTKR
jgi:hypothetical protein